MVTHRRLETNEAKQLRNQRQHFAAPGGSHDRLVTFLGKALPMGVGIVAALMIITPLSPGTEVSFLLDRDKVAMIDERLSVSNAMYRGQDDGGRPFSLTAGEAVQRSSREGIVRMEDMMAQILLRDGPARISAEGGAYDIDAEVMTVDGPLRLSAADGYTMTARGVSVDLQSRVMVGDGRVEGAVPAGTFEADRIEVDIDERKISLRGNARLTMRPGELRVP
ncbi:MAG: LPS export ABC transporter periplasmic protein LptC [Altererythrobacter sp. XM-24bin4]|jgi:lipopolysaccharide export system protein LptC|uniref:LPS export ABC transporter periplasmic protein LptC n=1 Tax=Altererythrobacter rubellus TaxID=2173831 RepID=A0A9Y2B5G1_9SPHN|nr:LPS export ABC transporter periplasmic protein LptC [Altererythrobacter rubellus]PWL25103.1 MAG: LPS export ABC transporter periplasmic protein LptC [Altererythrobacter sp. XM-24bin4]WIW95734.1 LPS export ABC transporter periplasmic protein LptC [Altererythrobacter rubellus]